MLGPEYWTALDHTGYFYAPGINARRAFDSLCRDGDQWRDMFDEEMDEFRECEFLGAPEFVDYDAEAIREYLEKPEPSRDWAKMFRHRGFHLIEDDPEEIAWTLRAAARRDQERLWLNAW